MVEGGILSVHSKDNRIFSIHGKIIDSLNINVVPNVSASIALDTALATINASVYEWEIDSTELFPEPVLLLAHIPDSTWFRDNYLLCYKILINSADPYGTTYIYVNAITGNVEFKISAMKRCNGEEGTGQTNFYGTQNISVKHRWLQDDYVLEDCDRDYETKWFNSNGNWASGSNVDDDDGDYHGFQYSELNSSVSAHWAAGVTHDIYKNVFGLSGMGGNFNGLRIYVWHHSELTVGTRFEGHHAVKRIFIGAWENDNTLDVMAHEWTHGVIEANSSGLSIGNGAEAEALDESFADIFGKIVEHREATTWTSNGVYHPANQEVEFSWIMGQQGGGTTDRSFSNPADGHPPQPDNYAEADFGPNSDPHVNSGPQNHWFYLLSEGLVNSDHLTGIGINKASKIAYRNMVNYIHKNSNYEDSKNGSVRAATEIFGGCSDEEFQNRLAWNQIGVGTNIDWCSSIKGPSNVCFNEDPQVIILNTFAISTISGAQIDWYFDNSFSYSISGDNDQYLTITSWGDAEIGDCFYIIARIFVEGVSKYNWVRVCIVDCEVPFIVPNNDYSNSMETNDSPGLIYSNIEKIIFPHIEPTNKYVFTIFPNPNQGNFFVHSDYPDKAKIEIYNSLKQIVYQDKINYGVNELNINSRINCGLYIINITNEESDVLHHQLISIIK